MAKNKIIFGNEVLIDLNNDTVEASKLARGYTAHDKHGDIITGENDFDMDTSEATAAASEILSGKTAGVNGVMVTGSMPNNGGVSGTISTVDEEYSVPEGYHDGSGKVSIAATEQAKLIANNIRDGVELLGVTGTLKPREDVTAQAKTATPYTTEQVILPDTGIDYLSQVTVEAIAYVETDNANGTTVTIGTVAPAAP